MRALFLLLMITSLASCHYFGGERISGNGHITTQQRNTGSFNSVDARGSISVHLRQDTSSVKIQADENLMQYIEVFIQGNTLVVKNKDGFNLDPSKEIIVYVSAPAFNSLDVSGSGDLVSDGNILTKEAISLHVSGSGAINVDITGPKITSKISGSGDVILKGSTDELFVGISGSGSIKCFGLNADNVSIDLSGSSDAQVTANKKLDINVSGSGDVQYKGNAAVSQHVSGSGSVKKVS